MTIATTGLYGLMRRCEFREVLKKGRAQVTEAKVTSEMNVTSDPLSNTRSVSSDCGPGDEWGKERGGW